METRVHGGLEGTGIRDRDGVLGAKPDASPQAKLAEARAKVKQLEHQHSEAQVLLRRAVEDDDDHFDFPSLKSSVHRLAGELAEAEEQVADWESVCKQTEKTERERRFHEALSEAREARQKFTELFRDCCLQLGRWYGLGGEIRGLVNALADRMPTGHVYYTPELKNALVELDANPDPLHSLLDGGYSELQTPQSWRRHCSVVPLAKKGEVK
jgi:hypothetical protein